MNKKSVIITSCILICFIITLCCALAFTQVTPDKNTVTDKYEKAGYKTAVWDLGNYSMRTYTKGDSQVFVIWYADKQSAEKSIITANTAKGDNFIVRRGNAIARGPETDIRIFQFA